MSHDPIDDLYRRTARERSGAAMDTRILAEAARQARVNAWLKRFRYAGLAAAAMILLALGQSSWRSSDNPSPAAITKYAATTRPYLLTLRLAPTASANGDVQEDDIVASPEDSE